MIRLKLAVAVFLIFYLVLFTDVVKLIYGFGMKFINVKHMHTIMLQHHKKKQKKTVLSRTLQYTNEHNII